MKKIILAIAIIIVSLTSCREEETCVERVVRENPGPTESAVYYIDVPC